MKVGVLQFFSWSRRVPLTTVYERAFARIEIMDRTGYDCVWLAEHHFNTYSVCPSDQRHGRPRRRPHPQPADRAGRVAGRVLQPAPARRGGRDDRRALGRPGELGRRPRLRPRRVRGLRRAASRRAPTASGSASRSCSPPGANERLDVRGPVLALRRASRCCPSRCRRPTRRCGWPPPRRTPSGARPRRATTSCRIPTPPTPTSASKRAHYYDGAARARLPDRGPGDPDRAAPRGRRHRPGGGRGRARRRVVDGRRPTPTPPSGPARRPRTGSPASTRWSAT